MELSLGACPNDRRHEAVLVVDGDIEDEACPSSAKIGKTLQDSAGLACLIEGRQQNADEHGDNSDDNQQLDEA
jgi:hypothetical protein